ncbi:MAG: PilZ domain-containing protein [Gammaproteobacteria bacterium]|nr:PilZ domain-containing protein [Gammaproteobacteria bacterium]MBI5619075.1 PilZ domain-containing protein [Gammaproteobacteria bacterium]
MKSTCQTTDRAAFGGPVPTMSERRLAPRYDLACSTLLRLTERLTFRCTLRNISLAAVQVECDPRYALLIHPMGADIAPSPNRLLDVSIALPQPGLVRGFQARCRVKYCTQARNRNMLLGLEFVEVDEAAYVQLERFIETLG